MSLFAFADRPECIHNLNGPCRKCGLAPHHHQLTWELLEELDPDVECEVCGNSINEEMPFDHVEPLDGVLRHPTCIPQ